MEPKGGAEKKEQDPADYLFQTTKYHDRKITVGDPNTDQVEILGVSTSQLVSHSTVFREMFVESDLADLTGEKTHITDVTPEVFKLMLRHVYGGKLPKMSQKSAAQLALCADKYNIQALVDRATELLVPTTVQDVFPALRCVAYITAPDLEKRVMTIIQEQTDKVIAHEEFLTLDGNCLEFIAKQESLAVSELQLWKGLFQWAKKQTNNPTEMRKLLDKPLRHVRLLTLTQDEVIKEVVPSNVLTSTETVDLLSAITNQVTLKSPQLSSTKQCRSQTMSNKKMSKTFNMSTTFSSVGINLRHKLIELQDYQSFSNFTIEPLSKDIVILSFILKARSMPLVNNNASYLFVCTIAIYTYLDGVFKNTDCIEFKDSVKSNENIVLPMKLKNGSYVNLKHPFSYEFSLEFSIGHPVFISVSSQGVNSTHTDGHNDGVMSVIYHKPSHVKQIEYEY